MDLKVDCDTKEHKSQITSSSVCELINLLRCIQSLSHTNQELSSESFKRFLFLLQSCGMKQNCSEESLSENVTFSELEANLKYILEKVPPLSSFLRAHVTFQPLYMEQLSLTTTAQNLTPVVRFFDNFHVNIFRENQFLWSSSAIHTVPNQCFGIDYDSIDFITLGPSTQFVHIVLKKDAFVFHNSLPIAANALSFRNTEIFPTSVFQSFFTQTINTVDKLCTLDTSCNIVSQQKFETLEVNIIEVPKYDLLVKRKSFFFQKDLSSCFFIRSFVFSFLSSSFVLSCFFPGSFLLLSCFLFLSFVSLERYQKDKSFAIKQNLFHLLLH